MQGGAGRTGLRFNSGARGRTGMNRSTIFQRLILVCAFLFVGSGCGGGGAEPAAPVQNGSEKKSAADAKLTGPETLATDGKSSGSKSDQASKNDAGGVEIPLDQIWALHMPGTKNILELDPDGDSNSLALLPDDVRIKRWKSSLMRQIGDALMGDTSPDWPREGQTARPGFAVRGTGVDALHEAYDVLVEHKAARTSFRASDPISIIFFSYVTGSLVDVLSVVRRDTTIELRYRFVGPLDKRNALQIALIPLGECPPNNYQVSIIQLPPGQELMDGTRVTVKREDWSESAKKAGERFVCHSFSFDVTKDRND